MHNQKRRAAPGRTRPSSTTNTMNNKGCRCKVQACFPELHGFPPPPAPGAGPLAEWLEEHPGWWGCQYLCRMLGVVSLTLRLQSQTSDGRLIFTSALGGLAGTVHSGKVEVQSCVAEMDGRIRALSTRIRETMKRAEIGGGR